MRATEVTWFGVVAGALAGPGPLRLMDPAQYSAGRRGRRATTLNPIWTTTPGSCT